MATQLEPKTYTVQKQVSFLTAFTNKKIVDVSLTGVLNKDRTTRSNKPATADYAKLVLVFEDGTETMVDGLQFVKQALGNEKLDLACFDDLKGVIKDDQMTIESAVWKSSFYLTLADNKFSPGVEPETAATPARRR